MLQWFKYSSSSCWSTESECPNDCGECLWVVSGKVPAKRGARPGRWATHCLATLFYLLDLYFFHNFPSTQVGPTPGGSARCAGNHGPRFLFVLRSISSRVSRLGSVGPMKPIQPSLSRLRLRSLQEVHVLTGEYNDELCLKLT